MLVVLQVPILISDRANLALRILTSLSRNLIFDTCRCGCLGRSSSITSFARSQSATPASIGPLAAQLMGSDQRAICSMGAR